MQAVTRDLDLQQYTRVFFRQPLRRCKNKIPVEREFGNSGLNVSAADYTAAADRQPSVYSKVANRAAARVGKSVWFTSSLLNVLKRLSATALSQQLPFRLLRQPGHTLHHG